MAPEGGPVADVAWFLDPIQVAEVAEWFRGEWELREPGPVPHKLSRGEYDEDHPLVLLFGKGKGLRNDFDFAREVGAPFDRVRRFTCAWDMGVIEYFHIFPTGGSRPRLGAVPHYARAALEYAERMTEGVPKVTALPAQPADAEDGDDL